MLHNESVNIWTHLLGTIIIVCLIIYTSIFISANKGQIIHILDNKWTMINEEFKNFKEPLLDKIHNLPSLQNITDEISNQIHNLPSFQNITNEISHKYFESLEGLSHFSSSVKNSTIEYIKILDETVGIYKEFFTEKIK